MSENLSTKTPEDWKNHFAQKFDNYLNNYSNEIPIEMVHGNNEENYKYKVRENWFSSVRYTLINALEFNYFPEDFNKEWQDFFTDWSKKRVGHNEVRTTKEEIDKVDDLLKRAKEFIKK